MPRVGRSPADGSVKKLFVAAFMRGVECQSIRAAFSMCVIS